ncbi:uncharacterized protein TNCV_2979311 [Trichonephila clavipes]|nr:uncharacterized protein TNCV_2979311 [Trichonephila clavipes]
MGAVIPNILQPGAFVWFEKTQGPLMKVLPMHGWWPMKQLAVRVHFLRWNSLLDDWSVEGVLSLVFINHRGLRWQWYDDRRTWTTEWNDIVFTDESHFCCRHDDRIRVLKHCEHQGCLAYSAKLRRSVFRLTVHALAVPAPLRLVTLPSSSTLPQTVHHTRLPECQLRFERRDGNFHNDFRGRNNCTDVWNSTDSYRFQWLRGRVPSSYTKDFGDGHCNFEPWSSDKDDT